MLDIFLAVINEIFVDISKKIDKRKII